MSTSSSSSSSSTLRMSGLASGLDTESIVKGLMSAQRFKEQKLKNSKTTTQWKSDVWKALNTKLYSFYTGTMSKLKLQGNYNAKKVTSSDEGNVTVTATSTAATGTHTLKISQLANSQLVTGAALDSSTTTATKLTSFGFAATGDSISVKVGTTTTKLDITDSTTIADLVSKLKNAGLNANYDTNQNRFFISSKDSGSANMFSLSTTNATALQALGLNQIDTTSGTPTSVGAAQMSLIAPKDARFEFDGVAMTSSSNTTTVNGLTIIMKSVTNMGDPAVTTDDEVVNLNVTNDPQTTYDMIKGFVKEYNTILAEMNKDYNAASAKGYDPLTDDQKAAMSTTQVDQWESKIKDSLLRRDDNLGSIINTMRSVMSQSVQVDGKSYSLANLGINSVNYTENGTLHINGDKDDSMVSTSDNDLMNTLTSDPDKVAKIISGVVSNLYTSFTNDMKSSSLRSALTMYNDKEMTKQLTDYDKQIKEFDSKLSDMENRYYKQFASMESALAKMNSQSSSLTSMLSNG